MSQSMNRATEKGAVLLLSIFMVFLLAGLAAALITYSVTTTKAITETSGRTVALYLAESGLDAARREVDFDLDYDSNGIGTAAMSSYGGTYAVTAVDRGDGTMELTSTGSASGNNVAVQQIVERVAYSEFPPGAISIVGYADKLRFNFKKHLDFIVDGATAPGITLSDATMHSEALEDFITALDQDLIDASNVTGSEYVDVTVPSEPLPVPLSVVQKDLTDVSLADLTTLYEQLVAGIGAVAATATLDDLDFNTGNGADVYTLGAPGSPVVVRAEDLATIQKNDTLNGYGTLILSDRFSLQDNSEVNWVGDVIVYGESSSNPRIDIDGTLNVEGNVIMVGEGQDSADLVIQPGGVANITGSVFMGTSYAENGGKPAKLHSDGVLNIDGVFSLIGSKLDIDLKIASELHVTGMMQIGVLEHPNSTLSVKFDGDTEVYFDPSGITTGVNAMQRMATSYSAPAMSQLVGFNVRSHAWLEVHE